MRPTHDDRSTCDKALEWIALELGDDATAEERERLRLHLERCDACRQEADALAESHRSFVEQAPGPPPEAELASLRAAVAKSVAAERVQHREGRGPSAVRWLALAAALWLAVTLALQWSRPPEPLSEGPELAHRVAPADDLRNAPADEPRHHPDSAPPEVAQEEVALPTRVTETRRPEPTEEATPNPIPATATSQQAPPAGPRGTEPPRVRTASLDAEPPRPAAPFTLKLVSDDPDLVIYWLVDPDDNHPHQENPDATAL